MWEPCLHFFPNVHLFILSCFYRGKHSVNTGFPHSFVRAWSCSENCRRRPFLLCWKVGRVCVTSLCCRAGFCVSVGESAGSVRVRGLWGRKHSLGRREEPIKLVQQFPVVEGALPLAPGPHPGVGPHAASPWASPRNRKPQPDQCLDPCRDMQGRRGRGERTPRLSRGPLSVGSIHSVSRRWATEARERGA